MDSINPKPHIQTTIQIETKYGKGYGEQRLNRTNERA